MLLVVRLAYLWMLLWCVNANGRDLYILAVGDSSLGNCNAQSYGNVEGVYQIGIDGNVKPARDPFDWSACAGGSIWMPMGRIIIEQGIAQKVIIMPVVVPRAGVRDWLPGGSQSALLTRAIETISKKNIAFDFVFWQQGLSDVKSFDSSYKNNLWRLTKEIGLKVKADRWLIAQGSSCRSPLRQDLRAILSELANAHIMSRYNGPDLDELPPISVDQACNLTGIGQRNAAALWIEAIKKSEIESKKFQKETLLFYFR